MIKYSKILLGLFCIIAYSLNAAEVKDYTKMRHAVRGEVKSSAFPGYVIAVDEDMYDSKGNFLIVGTENGEKIPYIVRPKLSFSMREVVRPIACKITSFVRDDEANKAFITLKLEKSAFPYNISSIEFKTPSRDFDKTLRISVDGKKLDKTFRFFNHAKNIDFSSTVVDLDGYEAKDEIVIEINNFAERKNTSAEVVREGKSDSFTEKYIRTDEFVIEGIIPFEKTIVRASSQTQTTTSFNPVIISTENKDGKTIIQFHNKFKIPFEYLEVFSDTPKYNRTYELKGDTSLRKSFEPEQLRHIAYGTISPEKNGGQILFNNTSNVFETIILTIENADNAPLSNINFKWYAPEYEIFMDGENIKGDRLSVYYSPFENVRAPVYDLASYAAKLAALPCGKFVLEKAQNNSQSEVEQATGMTPSQISGMISFAIILVFLILGILIVVMFRKISQTDTHPED